MKFYDRLNELKILNRHYELTDKGAILDVLIGRRRVGKTELANKFCEDKKHLYFFVGRKPLNSLLEEWSRILKMLFPDKGTFLSLDDFLQSIFELARREKMVIVFDEFQNFKYIYPAAFSTYQKLFDKYKSKSKMLLMLIGSVTTLMEKIFSDAKEPLFGRATRKLYVRPFSFLTVKNVLRGMGFRDLSDTFGIFCIFGGVPKYYSLIKEEGLQGKGLKSITRELIIGADAVLKTEGEYLLKEEFGKDYGRYFEIISLIARGKTRLSEIASAIRLPATSINAYLSKMEKRYGLIERRIPIFAKPLTKSGRYYVKDIFLAFWFRYVYNNLSLVESGSDEVLWRIISRDFLACQGNIFEQTIRNLLLSSLCRKFPFAIKSIGRWWDRRGQNEIDVVAVSEDEKEIFFGECKLNHRRVTQPLVEQLLAKSRQQEFSRFSKRHYGIITLKPLSGKHKSSLQLRGIMDLNMTDFGDVL